MSKDVLPVVTDANLKCVVSRGIELKGLKLANIPLKNVMRDVKMEKYEFIPFDEQQAIEPVDVKTINDYVEDCNLLVDRLASPTNRIGKESTDRLATILRRTLSSDQALLKLLVTLYKKTFDENGNLIHSSKLNGQTVTDVLRDEQLDLTFDQLNTCYKNGRMMRAILGK